MSAEVWLPREPNELIHLLDAESIRQGLEFGSFWLRMLLDDARRDTDAWREFVLLTQGKAIRGAREHNMDGWLYARPPRYWLHELKDELKDLATYGRFALWAADGHRDPRGRR